MISQVLRSQPATLTATFTNTAGVVVDPLAVTVTITRLGGSALVTDAATAGSGAVARTYGLTAAQTTLLDTLTAVFTSASLGLTAEVVVEIVGAQLFSEAAARAFNDLALASEAAYPDAVIALARDRTAQQFEEICGVSFIPRYRLDVLDGYGDGELLLPVPRVTSLRSIETRQRGETTWTAFTATELADVLLDASGEIVRESLGCFARGRLNVRVGYEHGFTAVPPDIQQAALLAARYELVASDISSRATSIISGDNVQQLWTPGLSGRGTAIHPLPEVDRVLRLYPYRTPVVG